MADHTRRIIVGRQRGIAVVVVVVGKKRRGRSTLAVDELVGRYQPDGSCYRLLLPSTRNTCSSSSSIIIHHFCGSCVVITPCSLLISTLPALSIEASSVVCVYLCSMLCDLIETEECVASSTITHKQVPMMVDVHVVCDDYVYSLTATVTGFVRSRKGPTREGLSIPVEAKTQTRRPDKTYYYHHLA